ncbi:MAG: YbfB/YjiJ family MFS transporter, partial [Lautropia sp.]
MAPAPVRVGGRGHPGAWATALCGMVSLAVAMGIGRFAFTPLLPMMLNERTVDLPTASWLASANYLAYMLGALLCTLQPWIWSRFSGLPSLAYSTIVRYGLAATGLLTVAMSVPWVATWPSLRFGAGIASAVVFVFTTGWCLARLARLGAPALGGVIFAGPGVGIVVSGLFGTGMVAWGWTAAIGWLIFGVLALVLTAVVWRVFQRGEERLVALHKNVPPAVGGQAAGVGPGGPGGGDGSGEISLLALAYGLAGFGYIVTA